MGETTVEGIVNREQILKATGDLARFLLENALSVKRVGIAGSFARGKEKPTDIDLIIFVDDGLYHEITYEDILYGSTMRHYKELAGDKKEVMEGLEQKIKGGIVRVFIDPFFLPDTPTDQQIQDYISKHCTFNPTLLPNLLKDVRIYNPDSNAFEEQPVYPAERMKYIEDKSFEAVKGIMSNPGGKDWREMEEKVAIRRRQKGRRGTPRNNTGLN